MRAKPEEVCRGVRKGLSTVKTNKQQTRKHSLLQRSVSWNDKVRKVGDSNKNWDTKVGYLNNGMSRLDTKSRTAPIVVKDPHPVSPVTDLRAHYTAGKLWRSSLLLPRPTNTLDSGFRTIQNKKHKIPRAPNQE
jgi:hypothetical protein